jgi:hypothetical protein
MGIAGLGHGLAGGDGEEVIRGRRKEAMRRGIYMYETHTRACYDA